MSVPAAAAVVAVVPSELTHIDITKYIDKMSEYPPTLTDFCKEHQIQLPSIGSLRGQAIALMAHPEVHGKCYIERTDTAAFFTEIGMKTDDSIQPFNKACGIKRVPGKGRYAFEYPFKPDLTDILKRKNVSISGDKNEQIESIKQFFKDNVIEVPNDQWQIGHLDPHKDDSSEANLAYQPPIQGKYRDRFKFCPMFFKMWPTVKELKRNVARYYSLEEQKEMCAWLNDKLKHPAPLQAPPQVPVPAPEPLQPGAE